MTVLGLICGINAAGLGLALMLRRWLSALARGTAEARRLAAAVRRATQAALVGEYRLVAYATGGAAPILFVLHWYWSTQSGAAGGIATGFWAVLALVLGAASACGAVELSARLSLSAALPSVAALRSGGEALVTICVRAGGAAALANEAVGMLALVAVYGLVFVMGAGLDGPEVSGAAAAVRAALLLPAFGLGSALAAVVIQRGGSLYGTTTDFASRVVAERLTGLHPNDARSPMAIANLVGHQVGRIAVRTVDDHVTSVLATLAALAAAAGLHLTNPDRQAANLAVAALPVVVRGFGLIAAALGLLVARHDELGSRGSALWRGQIASHVIAASGLAGSTIWILGEHWFHFFAAGLIVLISVSFCEHILRWRVRRRSNALREANECHRSGDGSLFVHAIGHGLEAPLLTMLVVIPALGVAWHLGSAVDAAAGGQLALLTALSSLLAVLPYMSALSHFATITESALGATRVVAPSELLSETRALDDARTAAIAVSRTHQHVLGGTLALLVSAVVGRFVAVPEPMVAPQATSDSSLLVLLLGSLGAAFILGIASGGLRHGARALRSVTGELERQLRPFARERDRWVVPTDFVPSYRSCVDVIGKAALSRLLPTVVLCLAGPTSLALGLQFLYREADPTAGVHGLAMFTAVAAVVGLVVALTLDSAHQLLAALSRNQASPAPPSALHTAGFAHALGALAYARLGAEGSLLIKVTALVTLALAPFLA